MTTTHTRQHALAMHTAGAALLATLGVIAQPLARAQELAPPVLSEDPAAGDTPGMEILARGPVHEAFAEQVSPDPSAGLAVPKAPPEPINEVPPTLKPEGDDVEWIPGYWFWDEDRDDFVWVSGVWRHPPPGRRWVPGYWQATDEGYQWIGGFWDTDTAERLEYLDAPPESLEAGPSSPAPSDDFFWIPGTWVWHDYSYRWRPGSWCSFRDGWVWVPARYIWTPRGCLYVSGYWDHTLTVRGHLFAPVYYSQPIYLQSSFVYRPVYWIGYEPLLLHLFVRPHCHHLYFGDYYGPVYQRRDYLPCYAYHRRYTGYASLYVYYQHHYHQHGIDYCGRVGQWHDYYSRHPDLCPSHTLRAQSLRLTRDITAERRHHDELARPLTTRLASGQSPSQHLVALTPQMQQVQQQRTSQLRNVSQSRRTFEATRTSLANSESGPATRRRGEHGALTLPTARQLVDNTPKGRLRIPDDVLETNRRSGLQDGPTLRRLASGTAETSSSGKVPGKTVRSARRGISANASSDPLPRGSQHINQLERALNPGSSAQTTESTLPRNEILRARRRAGSAPTTTGSSLRGSTDTTQRASRSLLPLASGTASDLPRSGNSVTTPPATGATLPRTGPTLPRILRGADAGGRSQRSAAPSGSPTQQTIRSLGSGVGPANAGSGSSTAPPAPRFRPPPRSSSAGALQSSSLVPPATRSAADSNTSSSRSAALRALRARISSGASSSAGVSSSLPRRLGNASSSAGRVSPGSPQQRIRSGSAADSSGIPAASGSIGRRLGSSSSSSSSGSIGRRNGSSSSSSSGSIGRRLGSSSSSSSTGSIGQRFGSSSAGSSGSIGRRGFSSGGSSSGSSAGSSTSGPRLGGGGRGK